MKWEKEMYGNTSQLMLQLEEVSKFSEVYTTSFWILASDF